VASISKPVLANVGSIIYEGTCAKEMAPKKENTARNNCLLSKIAS
jgi:hypothetical protein